MDDLWASLCTGASTAELFEDERLTPAQATLVCRVRDFDPSAYLTPVEVRRLDRSHALAIAAAQDAIDQIK